ncbi:MAG: hypothetical protein ACYTG2_00445 [Planctomycetota bacterium]|jgi:hypothetical protein
MRVLACLALGVLLGSAPAATAQIVQGGDVSGLGVYDFDDVPNPWFPQFPGTPYRSISAPGVVFGERMLGQTTSYPAGVWDLVTGTPSVPLTIDESVAEPFSVAVVAYGGLSLAPLGPVGWPSAAAFGEGTWTAVFSSDQDRVGFSLGGTDVEDSVSVTFYGRLGQDLGTVQVDHPVVPEGFFVPVSFEVIGGPRIAAITVNSLDPAGVDYDDVRYDSSAQPWIDLGFALAGTFGEPTLTGDGPLLPASATLLTLENAEPDAVAYLVVSLVAILEPFKGGVLVPGPDPPGTLFILVTDPLGELHLASPWPGGIPPGTSFFFQVWIEDLGGPVGFSASNALLASTP